MRAALLLVVLNLAACATPPAPAKSPAERTFTGLCALKPIGQNEEGLTFVLAHCEEKK